MRSLVSIEQQSPRRPCDNTTPQEAHPPGSRPPGKQTSWGSRHPAGSRHPPGKQTPPREADTPLGSRLRHTVNEWPVRILLECILVFVNLSFFLLQWLIRGVYGRSFVILVILLHIQDSVLHNTYANYMSEKILKKMTETMKLFLYFRASYSLKMKSFYIFDLHINGIKQKLRQGDLLSNITIVR